jgi:hypothetical protein
MIYSNVLQYNYQQNQDSQHEYDYFLYKRKAFGIGVVYLTRPELCSLHGGGWSASGAKWFSKSRYQTPVIVLYLLCSLVCPVTCPCND